MSSVYTGVVLQVYSIRFAHADMQHHNMCRAQGNTKLLQFLWLKSSDALFVRRSDQWVDSLLRQQSQRVNRIHHTQICNRYSARRTGKGRGPYDININSYSLLILTVHRVPIWDPRRNYSSAGQSAQRANLAPITARSRWSAHSPWSHIRDRIHIYIYIRFKFKLVLYAYDRTQFPYHFAWSIFKSIVTRGAIRLPFKSIRSFRDPRK